MSLVGGAGSEPEGQDRGRMLRLGPTRSRLLDPPHDLAAVVGLDDLENQPVSLRQWTSRHPELLVLARLDGRVRTGRAPLDLTDHLAQCPAMTVRHGAGHR